MILSDFPCGKCFSLDSDNFPCFPLDMLQLTKFFLKYIGENVMYFKNVFQSTHSPLKFLSSASLTNAFYISSYKYITKIPEKTNPALNTSLFDSESHILLSEFECDQCLTDHQEKNFLSPLPWVLGAHQALYHSHSSAEQDEGQCGSRQRKGEINHQLLLWVKQSQLGKINLLQIKSEQNNVEKKYL